MRRRDRQSAPPAPATPRVLAYVVHYFGSGSEFVGKSTTAAADERRAKVEQVLAALRALPYDVEVAVCGVPDRSLVPVDRDLSAAVTDPRHLAYAAIQAMAEQVDEHDYFLCVEDDVLVPAETVDRMIRFLQRARLNEVLLPNRLERVDDDASYCVDLVAMSGWQGLTRRFEGAPLGVAVNPHSGLTFLSAKQLRYATNRVDLRRRDEFLGGYMASAFANLHQPFLLWRTRDEQAHFVEHLDRWSGAAERVSVRPGDRRLEPGEAYGRIDEIRFDGVVARVRGWLAGADGEPARPDRLLIGDTELSDVELSVQSRPDVHQVHGAVGVDCGFTARFSLLGQPETAIAGSTVTVRGTNVAIATTWPGGTATWARAHAPHIPDSPFMPSAVVRRVEELLGTSACYLEYGTGGTTVLAARIGVPVAYCVESDESWLAAVAAKISATDTDGRLRLRHADIGPTGAWGYPVSVPPGTAAGDYALAIWREIEADGSRPDVVLVDGRYRVACFLASLLHAGPGARILFDDYGDRPHYTAVEAVVAPERFHDRTAEFVVPESLDRETAWALLAQHAGDTR